VDSRSLGASTELAQDPHQLLRRALITAIRAQQPLQLGDRRLRLAALQVRVRQLKLQIAPGSAQRLAALAAPVLVQILGQEVALVERARLLEQMQRWIRALCFERQSVELVDIDPYVDAWLKADDLSARGDDAALGGSTLWFQRFADR